MESKYLWPKLKVAETASIGTGRRAALCYSRFLSHGYENRKQTYGRKLQQALHREKTAWRGNGGKGGRKKRSGREDWTCKLCARKWIPYNVSCQKLNPSTCKSSFFPFFCSLHCSSEGQRGRNRDRKRGNSVFTYLLCVTKELYDPALTSEGMWHHKSDEQDNILLLIRLDFFILLYLATGILQYVVGLKYQKKCVSVQRLNVLIALYSVMKWGFICLTL